MQYYFEIYRKISIPTYRYGWGKFIPHAVRLALFGLRESSRG